MDQHRLADAGAAEQADLAALGVRREQIDDLDAGDEDLRLGRLLGIGRRRLVDGARAFAVHRTGLVDRLADDVDDAPERLVADRHRDRRAGVGDFLAAHQAFGRVHGDAAHGVSPRCCATSRTRRLPWLSVSSALRISGRCPSNCTSTTAPMTCVMRPPCWRPPSVVAVARFAMFRTPSRRSCAAAQSASAPEMISISSLVIIA